MPKILNVPKIYRTKEWLNQRYVVEKMPSREIANIVGADRKTIDQWLEKVGIEKRGFGGSRGIKPRSWLTKEYTELGRSLHSISTELGEDRKTIYRWLVKYNIPRHTVGDHRRGKDSPLWTGGKYRYEPNRGYRICRVNKMIIFEHRKKSERFIGRRLRKGEVIHHINFKRNDNRIKNLYLFSNQKEHAEYHTKFRHGKIGTLESNLKKGL